MTTQSITKEQALQKLKQYCAYQERCHSEVIDKLYSLGVWKKDHDEIIATLIEENYLNEERFAMAFAGGKFRMKQWGKRKIQYELKMKQVSEYCIKKALGQFSEEEYADVLRGVAEKKWGELKGEKNMFTKMGKVRDYLLRKGYEGDEVKVVLEEIKKTF